jgi:hypothetical protein
LLAEKGENRHYVLLVPLCLYDVVYNYHERYHADS